MSSDGLTLRDCQHPNQYQAIISASNIENFSPTARYPEQSSAMAFYRNHNNFAANTHPQSRQWRSPEALELSRLNRARRTLCPRSPYLPSSIQELAAHNAELATATARASTANIAHTVFTLEAHTREHTGPFAFTVPAIKPAFNGIDFSTNHSAVLLYPTIFVPSYEKSPHRILFTGGMAAWPSRQEMKYEGDDRVSTDRIHGRFPPTPRVNGNGTVSWQQRSFVWPEVLDNFYPGWDPVEVWWRNCWVGDNEIGDEEGVGLIGGELLRVIDEED